MMPLAFPRRAAFFLLRLAISIAPHDTLDWGHGMLSELTHVEGNWSALRWSLGGAGVLAKHAVLSAIFTGSTRHTLPSTSDLFEKESPMRKTTLYATAACLAATFLFFLAPVFRQAFHVSLAQWYDIVHIDLERAPRTPSPELVALERKAEQTHDAEALAFVAFRQRNPSKSVRLAEEAVQLDPKLTWVYADIAARYYSVPQFDRWVSELEVYDPQNALPHFIIAEKIDCDEVLHQDTSHASVGGIGSGREGPESPAWQTAMAAAFQSPKLDTYLDRRKDLDRKVLLHYHIDNPFLALTDDSWWYGLPSYSAWDSSRYAKSILESGAALEARGDRDGATAKYLAVARFSQLMGPAAAIFRPAPQETYHRLTALSEKSGNQEQAQLYTSLANQAEQAQKAEFMSMRNSVRGGGVSYWNALVAKASGFVLLFSVVLLLVCAFAVFIRARSLKLSLLGPGKFALALGLAGAVGSLLSSAMLYVSYRPYAQILQRFIHTGDDYRIPELSEFLASAQSPLAAQGFLSVSESVFYFWFGVSLLCAIALLFALWRFRHKLHVAAPAA